MPVEADPTDRRIADHQRAFTAAVLRLMERRGTSRSDLAQLLGTSPAYVTKILRGDANFTLASMVKLADALGAEVRIALATADGERDEPAAVRPPRRRDEDSAVASPRPQRPSARRRAPTSPPAPKRRPPDDSWRVW